jgi:ABC-type dipeptide/oligopeptide/nickel transport system ATPase subunit
MIECEGLTQTYLSGGHELTVLENVSFELEPGGFLAIVGPSMVGIWARSTRTSGRGCGATRSGSCSSPFT